MAKIQAILDEQMDWGFEGGAEYANEVVDLENGFEYVDSAWEYPRHRYNVAFSNMKDADKDYLINVFHACKGRKHCFKMKDWNDFEAFNQPLAVEVGTTNKVQLYRTYPFGNAYTIRVLQAFNFATIVDADDNEISGTLDLDTGEFTPDAEWPDSTFTWSGEYYLWVRFDADYNSLTLRSWRASNASFELFERKFDFDSTNVPPSWSGD